MTRMKRRWSRFTMEDVQKLADNTPVEQYGNGYLREGEYTPELCGNLVGKSIIINFDEDVKYYYSFEEVEKLVWKKGDNNYRREYCQVLQAPGQENVYLVQHYCKGSIPPSAHTLVLDFETGLSTLCVAELGTNGIPREVSRQFSFGIMEGYPDNGSRHEFTSELVGNAIEWTYHESPPLKIRHIYTAQEYYTYYMTDSEGNTWIASNPADYIKIRDNLYIFSFVEERQAGTQGFFLINLNTLHDVGSFFGVQASGLECYTFGAKGVVTEPYIS